MRIAIIFILAVLSFTARAQEVLKQGGEKTFGATTGQVLKWNGSAWVPDTDLTGVADAYGVLDSTAFRAFNVATAPKYIILTDSLRGGKFRRNYTAAADQYMVFTDALGRKWERFDYGDALFTEWFGAKGDSTTSDNVAFRKAFEFIAANPVNTIRLKNKKYVLSGTITGAFGASMTKGINIIGDVNTHIINKGTASRLFDFLNAEISLTLSANQVEGKNWARASGITDLRIGDLIFISSSEVPESGWGYTANDVHVINKINGDTLFFRNNLNFNYTTGTVTVFKGYKDRRVSISNIKFINDVAALSGIMYLSGLKGTTIDNVSIRYNTSGSTIYNAAQILNYKCADGVFTNIEINNSTYGLDVSSSRNSVIKNIKGNYSYGLAVPASWGDGFFVDNMSGNKITVDGHPSFNVHYKNVNITNGGAAIRSLGVNVENMTITNTDSTELFVFEMSGLMNDPYKSKIPFYPTILKNVQILSATKNSSVQTVDQNSTIYYIDGLVTNEFFVSRKTNIASADNLSIGYLLSWKPNVQYNNLVFDGRFTPSWATGFIKQDQAPLKINGLSVKNASTKTLFTHYNTAYNCHINNGVIDTILSLGNATTASSLTGLVLQNCQLKNFASASNNIAEFRNVEFDNSVSTVSINTNRQLPEWTNYTSNTYQNSGISIENTQGSGIPQVNFIAGGATGFQAALGLRGGTGSLALMNKRNDAGRVDIGVMISGAEQQKIRVDYNGLVGIGGVTAPTQPLQVGGNIRVDGAYYDSSNDPGTSGQVLSTTVTGTDWTTLSPSDAAGVLDSTAFRAFNVATAPKYIIMTDSLRGGKFRRCYTCTADQYMVFTDALGRKWERFNYTFVTPEMFGSRGGLSQDSLPLTRALNWPKKDVVFTRPYYSSATLTLTESKTIYGNHSVLKLKTVLSTSTPNFIIKASDVRVVDLTIKGLINTQTGEWSAGIQVGGPSDPVNNIVLENLNIRDTRGDGVYIASTSLKRGNIDIINVHTNNCMRNGMTITAGDNININGFTADSCSLLGIDLEPDVVTQVTRNLHINNIHVPSIGFGTHEDTIHSNITVQNFVIDNSKRGSSVSYVDASPTHKYGIILRGVQNAKFLNGNIINCKLEGIFFSANADRPCKDISFENIHMVNNHNTGTSFWVATEEAFERINFKNCNFIGSATFPFFTNVDAKWTNCKFTGFGAVVVNFGGVFENCEATVVDRFAYVPATPVVIRNSTVATGSLITPDSPTPILSGELINNTLTLSGAIIGGSLKHNIVTRDNLINGRYFDLVSSGMTINQTWLVKKTSGAMSITLPKWLGANKDFILVDSVRNGVTTITGDFVGAGSFATDGYSSYRFTFSGNVWHPEIASLNTPLSTILQEGATTGQAVTWNGSAWVAGNPVASLTLTNKQIGFGNVSNTLVGSSKFQYDDTDAAILLGDGTNVGYKIQLKRTAGGITTGEEISLYSNNSPTLQRVLGGFSNGELSGTSYAEANPAIDVFIPAARYRMFGRINVAASTAFNVSNVFPILTMMTNTGYAGINLAYGVDPSTNFHINGNLRVTGTVKDANNEDGTSGQVLSSTVTGTDWVADKNGYYGGNSGNGGDGTVPNGTTSTLANDFTLAGTDNVGGVPAFRVTTGGSAANKGLQTWRPSTGTDSLLLHTDAGAYKLDAKGKSLDISSPVGTSISTTSASITLAPTTGTIGVNAADRTDFTGTDLTFSTSSVGSTTAIMQPLVITAANVTVTSSQSEIICLGQSGDINLTLNYTPFSIIGGTHRIKITNSSPFKVILIRGGSWDWRDSYGVASVTNKTVYSGQTVDLIWGDGAGTDYWLIKTSESFTTGIQEETSTTVNYDGRSNMLYIPTSATTTTVNLPEIVASGPTVSQVTVGAKFKIAIDREANVTIARGGASDLIKAHNYSTTGQTSVVTTGGTFFTQTFTAVGANLWIVN